MSQTAIYILWASAIVIFAIVEGATVQLVSVWFVLGAVAALIAALCGAGFAVQIILFTAVSLLALVITRPLVKKFVKPKVQATNADRCLGAEGIVTERIDNIAATGQVKVKGNVWTARSASGACIEAGTTVRVERIEGVKLIVK
ncbi:MAG: NfeD family protein [Clostridia bacterium]|nr:NfeD family protein [Clostridia bacterium]